MKPIITKEIELEKFISGTQGKTVDISTTVYFLKIRIFKSLRRIIHKS